MTWFELVLMAINVYMIGLCFYAAKKINRLRGRIIELETSINSIKVTIPTVGHASYKRAVVDPRPLIDNEFFNDPGNQMPIFDKVENEKETLE